MIYYIKGLGVNRGLYAMVKLEIRKWQDETDSYGNDIAAELNDDPPEFSVLSWDDYIDTVSYWLADERYDVQFNLPEELVFTDLN